MPLLGVALIRKTTGFAPWRHWHETRILRVGGLATMLGMQIVDYDAHGYDYRRYWDGRDYEQWAEDRALGRLVPRLGKADWLIDLGGGFGRNAVHYREQAAHYVIADYSATNLIHASELLADDVASGRAFLVRCDVNRLPFVDAAFDAALVVRVLHHLPDIDGALVGMNRIIGGRWLVDVPIKHHALGLARAAARRQWRTVSGPEPLRTGTTDNPFWNYQLGAVRQLLRGVGWRTRLAASVNNLRRWDRRLPRAAVRAMLPFARMAEAAAQFGGRGWWGPSQFLLAERTTPVRHITVTETASGMPAIAARMACPDCRGGLSWTARTATCVPCRKSYRRVGSHWDFTTSTTLRDARSVAPSLGIDTAAAA
jgi:Methyltransferase domain